MNEGGPALTQVPTTSGLKRAGHAALPWGLLGMLALVTLGEWGFAQVEMDVLAPWHWDWRHQGQAARGAAAKADVLCLGDSLLKFGVLPGVVDGGTGRTTYNLALALGQPPSSYVLLRRALDAGARPSALLLDATPHLLRESPAHPRFLRQWPELLEPAEMLDLAWSARDPGFLAAMAAAKVLPTFRAREEIRTAVMAAFRGEPSSRRFLAARFWRNARINRGANVMPPIPLQGDLATACRNLYGAFHCDPVNAAYLDRTLDLAAARKIPVFWVIAPVTTEVQAMCEASGFDAAHTAFVRSLQDRHPGLTVLDGRRSAYGQELHTDDPVHLNRLGAVALSAEVAPLLRRVLAGERLPAWVGLPPYRPHLEEGKSVEDVNDSAVALLARATMKR